MPRWIRSAARPVNTSPWSLFLPQHGGRFLGSTPIPISVYPVGDAKGHPTDGLCRVRDPRRDWRARGPAGRALQHFGDVTQLDLLRRLHLETARALVVTLDDPAAADELVAAARRERQDLLIIARARDAAHAAHLYRIGASDAVPETIDASLQLSEAVLVDVGVPMGPVIVSIHEKRAALQDAIRAMVPEAEVRVRRRGRLRDRL